MEKVPRLALKQTCTGCFACVDACRFDALSKYIASDGHLYVKLDSIKCTICRKCENVCPIISKFSYERENNTSIPYAAWTTDDEIRMASSSGGIFATIAYHTIHNGGYVAGAVMDGISVKHILTDRPEDIVRMQGSKYQQGDSTGVYIAVSEKLKEGKFVFFTGVPCQVAGLYSFLGKHGDSDLLLTADLCCSGFPTSLLLERFLKEKAFNNKGGESQKVFVTYRSKDEGWKKSKKVFVTYRSINEDIEKIQKNLSTDYGFNNFVYNGFLSGNTQRYSCGDCRFALLHRKADFTLADFWDEKRFPEQHYKGISCVVTHGEKVNNIFLTTGTTFHSVEWKDFIPYNKLVYQKLPFLKLHPARIFMAWNFKYLSFPVLEKIYGAKLYVNDVLWLPYKIFNFIIFKLRLRKKEKYNTTFLKDLANK